MTTNTVPPTSDTPADDTRPLSAREWIDLLFDEGSFDEQYTGIPTPDPLRFEDSQPYPERLEEARRKTGDSEAVLAGSARLGGFRVVVAVSDFRFIGGSMGYVVGERVAHAMDRALEAKIPFIALTCSGGARMQEGMVALIQMAKTTAAAARLHEAGIPMVTVLANPTTGGMFASYATQADVLLAEAGALIGFAGPRVRAVHDDGEERETLYAEDLYEYGQVDLVAPRVQLRDQLLTVVSLLQRTPGPDPDRLPPLVEVRGQDRGWPVVERARHRERPRALMYIRALASDFVPLRGDRAGYDDPALVGGLARIGDTNVVVIGQERGDLDLKGRRHDGRVMPAGYRKAQRLMKLADRLHLPLVTFVDTPGARDGISDERDGLAVAISDCLATMAAMTAPSVAVIIGEGGSGGALALTWADRILMQQNAMYAITSPEGAAAILFRDRDRAPEVAEALGVSAGDLLRLGIIDEVVPEPAGGAHLDPEGAVRLLRPQLRRAMADAMRGRGPQRRSRRERRLRDIGLPHEEGAAFLRNIGDTLGDLGGAIGSRLRRRSQSDAASDEAHETEAPETEATEPATSAS
ncbi:MAG: acetyl-CoA carboxylase carboxyl transferase subunit beta [Dehalococcoidia bacterium]|nr:acetyl-CoA carboxylase carboxyl transferase subunit beta [Dehalococcoidia bacterium]